MIQVLIQYSTFKNDRMQDFEMQKICSFQLGRKFSSCSCAAISDVPSRGRDFLQNVTQRYVIMTFAVLLHTRINDHVQISFRYKFIKIMVFER